MNVGTLTANPILPWWNGAASPRRAEDLCFGIAWADSHLWGAHLIGAITTLPIWERTTPPGKPAVSLRFWITIAFGINQAGARWHVFL